VVQTDSRARAWTSRASRASASTSPCWYVAVCSAVSHSGEATGNRSRATVFSAHSATQGPRCLISKPQQRQQYQANSPGLSRYEAEAEEDEDEAEGTKGTGRITSKSKRAASALRVGMAVTRKVEDRQEPAGRKGRAPGFRRAGERTQLLSAFEGERIALGHTHVSIQARM
jgi:hypothetical protein